MRIELWLSPEPGPRIQTLRITPVPDPDPPTRQAVEAIVALINAPSQDAEADLAIADSVDRSSVGRAIQALAARFAPMTLGPVIGATDATETAGAALTFRLGGDRGGATLRIAVDAATGAISTLELRTAELSSPFHAD